MSTFMQMFNKHIFRINISLNRLIIYLGTPQKELFLVFRPLKPYTPDPRAQWPNFFGFFSSFKKSSFFLVARPNLPPLLVVGPLKKELFLRLPLKKHKKCNVVITLRIKSDQNCTLWHTKIIHIPTKNVGGSPYLKRLIVGELSL